MEILSLISLYKTDKNFCINYKIKIYQSKESETMDYPTRVTINITNSVINFKGEFKRERGYRGILFKDVVK